MYVFNSLPYPYHLLRDSFPSPSNPRPWRQELSRLHLNPLSDSHLTCCVTRGVTMSSPSKRRDMDVMKLMMADYKVEMVNDSMSELFVEFKGPAESFYEGGVWRVRVELPEAYPYKSPSIGFVTRIYHPNIDEISGSVCLNVINQTWSPMFDLVNIFEVFLPQLLLYPNPSDPLNGEAASLMVRDSSSYEQRVKEHCARYAKPEDIQGPQVEEEEEEDESESEDDKCYSSSEDEMEVEGI